MSVTIKQVCESWIRHTQPELTDDTEIARRARAFFDSSSDGSLFHVLTARDVLVAAGKLPRAEQS